jgi:glycerophosphoryl diester phosphodiesterase
MALVIAHRGEPRRWIENTLPAVRAAVDHGADAVEVDVRLTADGVPVLHHDPDLSRLWRHSGQLAQMRWADLRRDVPAVPSLAEALAAVAAPGRRRVPLVLDVGPAAVALAAYRVAADVAAATGTATHELVWFCGDPRALAAVRERDEALTLLLSWDRWTTPPAQWIDAVRPTFFNPWHRLIGSRLIDRWHERGIKVCGWTVDRRRRRERLLRIGVDAMISNEVANTVSDVAAALRARAATLAVRGLDPAPRSPLPGLDPAPALPIPGLDAAAG